MTTFAVIGFLATQASGAAGTSMSSADSRAQGLAARVFAPDLISGVASSVPAVDSGPNPAAAPECPSARQAVRFYGVRVDHWRVLMGATAKDLGHAQTGKTCPRYLSKLLRAKAYGLRKAYARWVDYNFAWWKWMPAKHQRVGACETGYGKRPGNFKWDSGLYVSFAGIYRQGYDDDAHRVGNLGWDETLAKLHRYPTPREQMQAVDSHRARWGGWSGWGCRGA